MLAPSLSPMNTIGEDTTCGNLKAEKIPLVLSPQQPWCRYDSTTSSDALHRFAGLRAMHIDESKLKREFQSCMKTLPMRAFFMMKMPTAAFAGLRIDAVSTEETVVSVPGGLEDTESIWDDVLGCPGNGGGIVNRNRTDLHLPIYEHEVEDVCGGDRSDVRQKGFGTMSLYLSRHVQGLGGDRKQSRNG